jgi:hypothetical protein
MGKPREPAAPSVDRKQEIHEALLDSAYLAGAKAGWNLGISEDNEGFARLVIRAAREAASPLTGRMELGGRSNTDTQTETISATPLSPAAVVDYTEQAREVIEESCGEVVDLISGSETMVHWRVRDRLVANIAVALSAVASERDAAAIRAFGKRVWSDSEEIAYQAGVSDTRERLQEPDVREMVEQALEFYLPHRAERTAGTDAALVVIKGILK